jgi:hypothetical protein
VASRERSKFDSTSVARHEGAFRALGKSWLQQSLPAQRSFMTPLRRRMTEDMQVRNLSPHTQTSYVQQVSLFARHFSKSPEVL